MKTKLAFLQTLAFALPLALWMPLSAQTQGTGELKPADQTTDRAQVFNFPGGTPYEFMQAVEKQFKADWLSVASIPDFMQGVRIPALRYAARPTTRLTTHLTAHELVQLYNRLAERSPELGTLVVDGDDLKPSFVMLVPNQAWEREQPKTKVRAFPIWGLSDALRENLQRDIAQARQEAMRYAMEGRMEGRGDFVDIRSLGGTVALHSDTKLLVAIGPDPYVEMVASIVAAYNDRAASSNRPPPATPPPGK